MYNNLKIKIMKNEEYVESIFGCPEKAEKKTSGLAVPLSAGDRTNGDNSAYSEQDQQKEPASKESDSKAKSDNDKFIQTDKQRR